MICYFCDASPVFHFVEAFGPHEAILGACCDEAEEQLANFDEWPEADRRAALDEAARELGWPRVRSGDGHIDYKLASRKFESFEQQACFAQIDRHHRHHDSPVGWKFGVGCYNGPTLVGTAVVGRPVNRNMQARGFYEVTRVCVHSGWPDEAFARHAASKLYAYCITEVKRLLPVPKLMTYTLQSETGTSFKHLGFKQVWLTKGGSWHCSSRPRTDKAPTGRKWLWVWPAAEADKLIAEREAKKYPDRPPRAN